VLKTLPFFKASVILLEAMFGGAGAAFGGVAAVGALNSADRATQAVIRKASAFFDRFSGQRYTSAQKQRLEEYKRLCSTYCPQTANLEYFAFNETDSCPVKDKDALTEPQPQVENADAPFNLCKERRALLRCINRSWSVQARAQEGQPIYSPEVYALSELRKWSRGLTPEPTREFTNILECRTRYVTELNRYSQKHDAIAKMPELLGLMQQLLSSCRDKARYHEWRQLLPRLHGEANSMCESLRAVLRSIIRCSRDEPCVPFAADSLDMNIALPIDNTLKKLDETAVAAFCMDAATSAGDIYKLLFRTVHEIQEENQLKLGRYLLLSDGLPLTSVSNVDSDVVWALRECLSLLSKRVKIAGAELSKLCARCDVWYGARKTSSSFRAWKANYDDIRDDVQDVHAAVDLFLRYAHDADVFLHQQSGKRQALGYKRVRSSSPSGSGILLEAPHPRKKLKEE